MPVEKSQVWRVVAIAAMRETEAWSTGQKDERMPLSEDEQRILDEIEKNLHESDPRLAREVGETTVYRHALGSIKWSVVGLIVGLAVMVATLQIHFMVAFIGFLIMLVSALGFERNLRLMGRAGMRQVSTAFRAANPNVNRRGGPSIDD
ncbi:MAG: DUF3040 domain-containing protein [Acidimicrobiales bacterium]